MISKVIIKYNITKKEGKIITSIQKEELAMIVRFETEEFEFSRGYKPKGYGCWMIEIDGQVVEFRGTITELRKYISQTYRDKGQAPIIQAKILA